ncbi:hypothetical protein [Rhodocista pekingensis]|uniref:Flagellar hook-length control protein-like C-terminal domain-containing protein n=1 Tax=Rhodocista pekingensis TaxID=201185 RepID=A0ABW2L0J2_9PROT
MAEQGGYGPGGVAPVGGVGPVQRPVQAHPAVQAPHALVAARPPELPAGTVTVTGVLGAAGSDGLLPLTTSFGTLLLRPVPGAWPPELPAGSNLTVNLGSRGSVVITSSTPTTAPAAVQADRAATLPIRAAGIEGSLASRAVGASEAALRGLLALSATPAATQPASTPAVPPAALPGAVPNAAPGSPHAPAATPALLSVAGSIRGPTVAPTPVAALPSLPRGVTAPASPVSIPALGRSLGGGTDDLLRQGAAVAARGPATGQAAALGTGLTPEGRELLADLAGGAEPEAAPRPDLLLAAALANPAVAARLNPLLPRPDRLGGLALLLYLFGARGGGLRAWTGLEGLERAGKVGASLKRIEEAMTPTPRPTADGSVWSALLAPLLDPDGDGLSILLLASRQGPAEPLDGEEDETATPRPRVGRPVDFAVGAELSELGPVQILGRAGGLDLRLEISVGGLPEPGLRQDFEVALAQALPAVSRLRVAWGTQPAKPELMPGGMLPRLDARL